MTSKKALVLTGMAVAIGILVIAAQQQAVYAGGEGTHEFVGSKSCKKCHSATYKSWEKTAHGTALESLKPGQASEVKAKFNLDPAKDYSTDESCLKCHSVGFGQESGYFVPDAADKKAVRKAAKLAGVGCESCHGAGKEYSKVFKEIMTSKRMYKLEELTKVGLHVPNEETCTGCHNTDNPTSGPDYKFNYEEMKAKGVHDHEELKQREG